MSRARIDVISAIESGDSATGEILYSGTNTGAMPTPTGTKMPATGKKLAIPGALVIKMKEGKIISFHGYHDQATMASQTNLRSSISKNRTSNTEDEGAIKKS
jgi:hypothetical protein